MRYLKSIVAITLFVSFLICNSICVFAHEQRLNISYDDCINDINSDSESETWYGLIFDNREIHIDHNTAVITYYIENHAENDASFTWETNIYKYYQQTMSNEEAWEKAELMAQNIKSSLIQSIEKWNDVYYYQYDRSGNKQAKKI